VKQSSGLRGLVSIRHPGPTSVRETQLEHFWQMDWEIVVDFLISFGSKRFGADISRNPTDFRRLLLAVEGGVGCHRVCVDSERGLVAEVCITGVWSPRTISGGVNWSTRPCSGLWEPLFSFLGSWVDAKDAARSGGDGDGVG
jgi:hypothetical protein